MPNSIQIEKENGETARGTERYVNRLFIGGNRLFKVESNRFQALTQQHIEYVRNSQICGWSCPSYYGIRLLRTMT